MKPLKINKILVPFDFTDYFKSSFKMAIDIAMKSNAKITLVFAINSLQAAAADYVKGCLLPLVSNKNSTIDELKKRIHQFMHDQGIEFNRYKVAIETGKLFNSIVDLNIKNNYDLIILPDSSKTAIDRLVADINVLELMQVTKTAVIAVPEKANIHKIKRIVLPIRNVKNWYDKLPITLTIANLTGASVYIIGVANTNSEVIIRQIKAKVELCRYHFILNDIMHFIDFSFCHGDPTFDVHNLALYKNADLIVVSPPDKKAKLKAYLNTSMYNKLMEKGNIPIMGVALT